MAEQIIQPHGYAKIAFEDASIPQKVWDSLLILPNECWVTDGSSYIVNRNRFLMVMRIARINPAEALTMTPTCGDHRCCNPNHTCITMMTPLSRRE
jgi:hypothetical protein